MKGLVIDIDTGDLLVEPAKQNAKTGKIDTNGCIITDCETQVVENILLANRGEFKELPLIGAETRLQLGGERDVMWATRTKKMIKACGVEVRKISITDNTVTVE